MMYTILSIVLLLVPRGVAGFGFVRTSPLGGRQLLRPSHTHLHGIRCEDKQYQLEEREDAECSTTELYLNTDRSIRFGETDGPLPTEVKGSWQVTPATDDFSMTISRTFGSGREGTDMGEFAFTIVRNYVGEMTMVGECVAITGVMRNQDDTLEDKEVGFFSMIDGTDERASYASDDRLAFEVDGTKGRRVSEVFGQPAKEAAVVNGAPPPPSHYQQPQQPQQQQQQRQQQQQYQQQAQQQQAQQQQYQQPHYQQPQMPQAQPQPFNIVGEFGFQVNFFGEWQQGRAGPGGLDPVQVLQALPPDLTQAFQHRSNAQLKAALRRLALPDVQYYMKGCVDAGLWINPAPREQRLGPGGLDPLEILERLPPSIVEAFQARDRAQLNTALGALSQAELDQYIEACVNAGLWTVPR